MVDEPAHTLIQLTDLHIGPGGDDDPGPVDTLAVLDRALQAVQRSGLRPSAVLFTGDLTENGAPAEYRRLRAVVDPALERIGARAVYVAGNHDDRAALREHLLDEEPSTDPLDRVTWFGDLRVVALDSTVPGLDYGELRPEQLDRLRAELASPAPAGTVLALHHPPLPSAAPLAASIELVGRADLGAAIAGTDVRAVLAGHTHVLSAGVLAGVPVWTGGAISSTLDGLLVDETLRGLADHSVSRLDLFDDAVLVTNLPFDAEELSHASADEMRPQIAALRAQLPG